MACEAVPKTMPDPGPPTWGVTEYAGEWADRLRGAAANLREPVPAGGDDAAAMAADGGAAADLALLRIFGSDVWGEGYDPDVMDWGRRNRLAHSSEVLAAFPTLASVAAAAPAAAADAAAAPAAAAAPPPPAGATWPEAHGFGVVPAQLRAALAAAGVAPTAAAATLRAVVARALDGVAAEAAALWPSGAAHAALASLTLATLTVAPERSVLRALPPTFEGLFHASLALPCALCAAKPPSRSRALCLSCGACVCGPDTPHGPRACLAHARECGGGTALFLLTNSSGVLLVRDRRLMLLSSPYRDAHGEVDLGLLRGKPLTLAPAEYAALTRQWVALAFDEVQRGEDELMMF